MFVIKGTTVAEDGEIVVPLATLVQFGLEIGTGVPDKDVEDIQS
jgi:hypothetical protein